MTEETETPSCPRCGKERFEGAVDCPFCGIVFSRFEETYPGPELQSDGSTVEDDGLYRGPIPGTPPANEGLAVPHPSADVSGSRPIQVLQIPIERSRMADFLQFDLTRSMLVVLFVYIVAAVAFGQILGGVREVSRVRAHHFAMTGIEAPLLADQVGAPAGDLHLVGREFLFLAQLGDDQQPENAIFAARRRSVQGHRSQEDLRQDAYDWLGALGSNVQVIKSVDTSLRGRPARVDILHPDCIPQGMYATVATFEHEGRPVILLLAGNQQGVSRLAKHYFDDNLNLRRTFYGAKPLEAKDKIPATDPAEVFRVNYLIGAVLLVGAVGLLVYFLTIMWIAHWLDLEGGLGRAFLTMLVSVLVAVVLGFIVMNLTFDVSEQVAQLIFTVLGIVSSTLAAMIVYTAGKREALIVALGSSAVATAVSCFLAVALYGF